jgi:hypothetical protein
VLSWLAERSERGYPLPAASLRLVDQGSALVALAEANLRGFAARALPAMPLQIETRVDGVERYLADEEMQGGFALVGAAMMLNELDLLGPRRVSTRAEGFAGALRRLVRAGGCVLLVEPGTRKGYMNLMALREHLRSWPILYPCPHGGPCPMWEPTVRQWCHATRPLPSGFFFDAEVRRFAELDFEMRSVNLAGLAFQAQPGARASLPFQAVRGARIVSNRMPVRSTKESGDPRPRKRGRGRPASRPAARPRPPQVVLECGADGQLRERPAEGLGSTMRGAWVADPWQGGAR